MDGRAGGGAGAGYGASGIGGAGASDGFGTSGMGGAGASGYDPVLHQGSSGRYASANFSPTSYRPPGLTDEDIANPYSSRSIRGRGGEIEKDPNYANGRLRETELLSHPDDYVPLSKRNAQPENYTALRRNLNSLSPDKRLDAQGRMNRGEMGDMLNGLERMLDSKLDAARAAERER